MYRQACRPRRDLLLEGRLARCARLETTGLLLAAGLRKERERGRPGLLGLWLLA